jgi:hypothetical protein
MRRTISIILRERRFFIKYLKNFNQGWRIKDQQGTQGRHHVEREALEFRALNK